MDEMKMYAAISNTKVGVKLYLPPSVMGPLGLPPFDKLPDQSRDPDQGKGESWAMWPLFQIVPTWDPEAKRLVLERAWSNDEPDRKRLMRYHTERKGWKQMRPFCLYAEMGTVMPFEGLPKCKSTHVPMTIVSDKVILDCDVRLKPYSERAEEKAPEPAKPAAQCGVEQGYIPFKAAAQAWQKGGGRLSLDMGDGKPVDVDFNRVKLVITPPQVRTRVL